jgi:hypothetical protein
MNLTPGPGMGKRELSKIGGKRSMVSNTSEITAVPASMRDLNELSIYIPPSISSTQYVCK